MYGSDFITKIFFREGTTTRVVIAPQALKGSLTAEEVGQAIALGVQSVYSDAYIDIVPVADGGEGTVQALVDATGGQLVWQTVTGPLGTPVSAFFGLVGDDGYQKVYELGVDGIAVLPSGPMTLPHAMEHAAALTTDATERMLRVLRLNVNT